MKWITVLNSLTLILFTVLFFADYFPKSIVAETIPQGILLLLLIGTLIGKGYLDKHAYSLKDQIISFLYMIFLLSLFTFLGGKSQIGFSFDGYLFWFSSIIASINIYKEWKEMKQEEVITAN